MIHINGVINHRISKLIEYSLEFTLSQEPDRTNILNCFLGRLVYTYVAIKIRWFVAYHTLTTILCPCQKKQAEYNMT